MQTIEIPGGTAELRDPKEVSPRGRKTLEGASFMAMGLMAVPALVGGRNPDESQDDFNRRLRNEIRAAGLESSDFEALITLQEATIVARLKSWTLDQPLPTMQTIGDLDGDLYDALMAAVDVLPAAAVGTSFAPSSDPESPTTDSGSSTGPSMADPESPSTPISGSDGSPTSGEASFQEP